MEASNIFILSFYDPFFQGCDTFVFLAILEFTLAQYLMRRVSGDGRRPLIPTKSNQVQDFQLQETGVKVNLFHKIIGVQNYMDPIKGFINLYFCLFYTPS